MSRTSCPRCAREVGGGRFCPGCGARLGDPLSGVVIGGRISLTVPGASGPVFTAWEASHRNGGAPFAVRILNAPPTGGDDRRRRFLENAGAALGLMGDRLLAVREMAEEEARLEGGVRRRIAFVVSDAAAGPSLAEVVRHEGPLAPARAVAVVRDVLRGLAVAHAAGFVHGDLHPGSVFLEKGEGGSGERARVSDTGLSRGLLPEGGEPPNDPAGVGSDGGRWISPEQAEGRPPGPEADLHAAGLLLHFALTGTLPWKAAGGPALVFEIARSLPPPPSAVRPSLPPALDAVVARALGKHPGDRFPSATEFDAALDGLETRGEPAPARGGEPVPTPLPSGTAGIAPPAVPTGSVGRDDPTAALPAEVPPPSPPPAPPPAERTVPVPVPAGTPGGRRETRPVGAPAPPTPPAPSAAAPAGTDPARASSPAVRAGGERRAWSVGGPVAVFTILGALAVGGLYGVVWAGYLDWEIPTWMRRLTGRDAPPVAAGGELFPARPLRNLQLNVKFDRGIDEPVAGEGEAAIYGTWLLRKDPGPDGAGEAAAAGGEESSPVGTVFARGELRGRLEDTGHLPVLVRVPPGSRYRFEGTTRYGEIRSPTFEVQEGTGRQFEELRVVPGVTELVVRIQPAVPATVTLSGLAGKGWTKEVPDSGQVTFGLPSDGEEAALRFGETWTVGVEADGFEDATSRRVELLARPTVVELRLERTVAQVLNDVWRNVHAFGELPERYDKDPIIEGDPGVKILLGLAAATASPPAWARAESYILDLEACLRDRSGELARAGEFDFPKLRRDLYAHYHTRFLIPAAEEAAARGDLATVRELAAKARPEVLLADAQAETRGRFARLECEALFRSTSAPPPASGDGSPLGERFAGLQRLVRERLPLIPRKEEHEMRRRTALLLVDEMAWPAALPAFVASAASAASAADRGIRPPEERNSTGTNLDLAAAFLDLAEEAWPLVVDEARYRRLRARLVDRIREPEKAIAWLLKGWSPETPVPDPLPDEAGRFKEDRLLLARALFRWGKIREEEGSPEEAARIWQASWTVYQKLFDPDDRFPLRAEALLEGARVASRVRDSATVIGVLEQYLALRAGDPWAQELRDALRREVTLDLPVRWKERGIAAVEFPATRFEVGSGAGGALPDERPFRDGRKVPVATLAARDYRVPAFLLSEGEVTWGIYKEYLKAMADPATAARHRHPSEPAAKGEPGARVPSVSGLADGEPVRGVDWWDAFACARWLGGRLPTEEEWEVAARWAGTRTAPPDGIPLWRKALGVQWPGFWPDNGVERSVFDRSPSGVLGMHGGVAEWTLGPWDRLPPAAREGAVELGARSPATLDPSTLMAVRGGSFFHRPPGEGTGPSPVKDDDPAARRTAGGEGGAGASPAAPPPPTEWRAMDLRERRGLPAGARPKWVGFRVAYGPGAELPR